MKNITASAIIAKTDEVLSRVGAPYARSAVLSALTRLYRGEAILRDGYHPTALDVAVYVVMLLTTRYSREDSPAGSVFRVTSPDAAVAAELEAAA